MSSLLSNVSVQVKAAQGKVAETPLHDIKTRRFRGGTRTEEKDLEGEKVVGTVSGASNYLHGCKDS